MSNAATCQDHQRGFLADPFGWAYDRLEKTFATDPALRGALFAIDQPRMHLIALALAHLPDTNIPPNLGWILLQGSRSKILDVSIGRQLIGIDRALCHLPPNVLPIETYRTLVSLLTDPVTSRFLHHRQSITKTIITGLHRLPPGLRRPAIFALFDKFDGMEEFVDGLEVLASRAQLPFDNLVTDLRGLDQRDQVIAKIAQTIDRLPFLDALPPVAIGGFRRIDTVAEIRALANQWHNCLATCLDTINDGTGAVYLSANPQAVCFLSRYGRLGWFVAQIKGPKNADLEGADLARIYKTFAASGFLKGSIIQSIKEIGLAYSWSRHRLALNPVLVE